MGGKITLMCVCIVLGFMLAVQARTQLQLTRALPYQRLEEVTALLYRAEEERDLLRREVSGLRSQLAEVGQGQAAIESLRAELDKARMAAGLVPVVGPGISVVMDDSRRAAQPGEDPNLFIIHDDDILKVVNELVSAGAEAISINGQRLIATSEVRCAGPTISVNNTRTAPPVQVLAIGDPDTLEAALRMRGGVIDSLALWGIEVRVSKETAVVVPAFEGSLLFRWAQPVGEAAP